jgi:hypothetical protein
MRAPIIERPTPFDWPELDQKDTYSCIRAFKCHNDEKFQHDGRFAAILTARKVTHSARSVPLSVPDSRRRMGLASS